MDSAKNAIERSNLLPFGDGLILARNGVAHSRPIGEYSSMAVLTIQLEDEIARHVEESARREHKYISEWVKERVKPEAHRAVMLAAMEARAVANGYPSG